MPIDSRKIAQTLQSQPWAQGIEVGEDFWLHLAEFLQEQLLSRFLDHVIVQVDEILGIDPDLPEPKILEMVTQYMVRSLGAHSASVRIYDPQTQQMLSYGSYPSQEGSRETLIPLEGSIAGEVVRTRKPCTVGDIEMDHRYQNKEVVQRRGVHSLLAIPLEIPRFYPRERDTVGVMQIYFVERGRLFSPLEIQMANLMARRLTYVIARKKIFSLQKANEKKDVIVQHLFRTLGSRGGVKIKEVFDRIIPELADIVHVQAAALFSVSRDLTQVVLEAGYPEIGGYHTLGTRIPLNTEPVFELALNLRSYDGDSVYEVVTPSYVLVVNPKKSRWISENLRDFAAIHRINSILYLPLNVDGQVTHIMTFDAVDQRLLYTQDEIDVFVFLGRELMKAKKMERLDDALHDFKNPSIAIAGFARRLKRLLKEVGSPGALGEEISRYADILLEETSRLQELALSIYQVGEEKVINLTEVLRRRFVINKEAIREQLRQNINSVEGSMDPTLQVRGYPIHLERVFDNLLNNATKAIPLRGGKLTIRTYADGEWACAEVSNTGQMSEEDRLRLLEGEGEGRGLYITHRIMRLLKGGIDIRCGANTTTVVVRLPLCRSSNAESRIKDSEDPSQCGPGHTG